MRLEVEKDGIFPEVAAGATIKGCCMGYGAYWGEHLRFEFRVKNADITGYQTLPIGPKVVSFGGSHLEFYMVIPKRNYFGAYGYSHIWREQRARDRN